MADFKSGFVAIIGRSNVGKSTLLNQILKGHFLIVSPKTQTTRNKIKGIYTKDDCQIVFIDTPGLHKATTELGNVMNEFAYNSLEGVDLVLLVVDASVKKGKGDDFAISILPKKVPTILILNKVDLVKNVDSLKENIDSYKEAFPFSGGITVSSTENFNVDTLIEMIKEKLPVGPKYYPDDEALDLPIRFVVSEIIREKILLLTNDEIPYSVAVTIEAFKEEEKMVSINATIVVERSSQKKIIIGKNGNMIKQIGHDARIDIMKLIDKKVYLELFVKVEEEWRNNKHYLREYGYHNDDE